ncbi:MAG: methyltransferase domain-containing protein [Chloroflexi bacterium]|nr:methyltransferase domain-containing protein [Chloroflexota bacterium]
MAGLPLYHGRWGSPDFSSGSLRNWLVKKERFFLTGRHGRGGRVLDLGCGGGWRFFTCLGSVVGVDISPLSLQGARQVYPQVVAAHLGHLPFADDSFDVVVSLDVLGHIPQEEKERVLQEIYRVLRPGGRTLHYIETEGDDPLTRWAKGYPPLYRRHLILPEGHVGLEAPRQAIRRFRKLGLRPRREVPAYKMFLYVQRWAQCFDNEYAQKSPLLRAAVALSKTVTKWPPLLLLANGAMALLLEITDRLLPFSWAGGVMVDYDKEAAGWS